MKKVYLILLAAMFAFSSFSQKKVLMVILGGHANDKKLYTEMKKLTSIATLDTILGTRFVNMTVADSFKNYDAVILSESVASANTPGYKTAGFPKPMLNLKAYAINNSNRWGWTESTGTMTWKISPKTNTTADAQTFVVKNATHAITKGIGLTANQEVQWTTGKDADGEGEAHVQTMWLENSLDANIKAAAVKLATNKQIPDTGFIWAIDENTTCKRMVIIGVHNRMMGSATPAFYGFLRASMQWVMGLQVTGIDQANVVSGMNATVFNNNGTADVRFNLVNAANVNINMYDVLGRQIVNANDFYTSGTNMFSIPNNGLKGVYIVTVEADGVKETVKVLF